MGKNYITLWLSVIVILILFSCASHKRPFSKKDIKHAQKLIGIEFSDQTIDTLYDYSLRNLAGFDSMRTRIIGNDIFPALLFNPLPNGFQFPGEHMQFQYSIDESLQLPRNKNELPFLPVHQLASLIKTKKLSSEELTRMYLKRIHLYDHLLKSFITLTEERAVESAKKADIEIANGMYKGPLHGIPFGVKDLATVAGHRTTWGSKPFKDQEFDYTATIVNKLEEAGAVLLGKLSSGALARGDVWFGGQTMNPWDTLQGASGSSAGAGSATAAGLVGFSIGTETLGSITSPSNRNGVTGLRPTYGMVSRYGVMSLSWSMDKIGPICRSATDCALVFDVIRGPDGKDQTIYDVPFNYDPFDDLQNYKIGYLKNDIEKDTTDVGKNLQKALTTFRDMGIELVEVTLPEDMPYNAFDIILRTESGAFFDQLVRSGKVDDMVQQTQRSRANSLRQSRFIPAVEYLQANRFRTLLIEEMHNTMSQLDVLIAPTFGSRQLLITNLTGHPAITIPTGLDQKGRPTSITLLANLFKEGKIIRLAEEYQKVTNFDTQRPPLFSN